MKAAPSKGTSSVPWWRRPRLWLVVLVVGFFAISSWAGFAAYSNFQTANSTDAGVITQAVASTTFGRHPVFFESYDCFVKTRCSFLLVHTGFVLYGAVPFFALWPSTITLFVLRSALVAVSAIPLYWLTRQVTGSTGKALLAAGLFLAWGPSFLGDAFSLHLETILPLELFTLAAFWQAGRYRVGLGVAVVAFLTMEIAPIFTFLVGLFFLEPRIAAAVRRHLGRARHRTGGASSLRSFFSGWTVTLREGLRLRDVRYAVGLLVGSGAAYVVLLTFMNVWGATALGTISPIVPSGLSGVFYNNSSPGIASMGTIITSRQSLYTAEFWLVLYATLAFVPLLSPRALILSVPWIGWTFLTDSSRFTTIGHQYTMIAAGPLFVGLAFGLRKVRPKGSENGIATARPGPSVPVESVPAVAASRWRGVGKRRSRALVTGVFGAVFVANLLLVPVNPLLTDLGVTPGAPFESNYFHHTLAWNPSITSVEAMVATIPRNATVTAPPSFFPIIAAYPHAYELVSPSRLNLSNLPFNASGPPQFVLITPASFTALGREFRANLSNPADFGMSGYVSDASLGPLFLYERGYTLPATRFGPGFPVVNETASPGIGLNAGPIGQVVANSTSPTSSVVESALANRTGLFASTTELLLPPGNYTIRAVVAVSLRSSDLRPRATVLHVEGIGFGPILLNDSYKFAAFTNETWTNLTWNVVVASPLPELEIRFDLLTDRVWMGVAAVTIEPTASD